MRILILSDSDSPHTIRWAKAICQKNNIVGIFSIHGPESVLYGDTPSIKLFSFKASRELQFKSEAAFSKLYYIGATLSLKKVINEFKPDILHSHYASSYGLIGALSGFHPFIISMWGSDIFSFPNCSFLHKAVLKFSLSRADKLLSTSYIMKSEAKKYTNKDIVVTPFGIDVNRFKPKVVNSIFKKNEIVVGTIKNLEEIYGIEYLIKAFKIVKTKLPSKKIKLMIAGEGSHRKSLEELVIKLNLSGDTIFTGYINNEEVQNYHNMLDIYVAVSLQESFGVAILEASACSKPVVVSNVGGLSEVVDDNKTGFIVEKENTESIAEALEVLLNNEKLRNELGRNGRNKVIKEYNWNDCVDGMISIYRSIISNKNRKLKIKFNALSIN